MRVKWIAIGLLISFLVNSCLPLCGCSPVEPDTTINIVVKNSAGENMLHPATNGHFTPGDIELYYLEDGKKVKNTRAPSISIMQAGNSVYSLAINSNYPSPSGQAITFLEFKNIKTDTLTCFYSGAQMTEIKVNANTAWNSDSLEYQTIEIIVDR